MRVAFVPEQSPSEVVVVDMSALSLVLKGGASEEGLRIAVAGRPRKLVSFQSVAELYALVIRRCLRQERIRRLEAFLAEYEVIYPDEPMCLIWATLMNYCRAHAHPCGEQHVWVAATAVLHGAAVCTLDHSGYAHLPEPLPLLAASA